MGKAEEEMTNTGIGQMDGHVIARRVHIRTRAQRGDERASKIGRQDVGLASVDALLNKWGRWAIRCESGALGFAASCALGGDGGGDSYDSKVPHGVIDEDMEAVNGAVKRLPAVLREVVMRVYMRGQGKSDVVNAQALGISRQALVIYREEAQRKIALDISRMPNNNPP